MKNKHFVMLAALLILLVAIPMTMAKDSSYRFAVSRTLFIAGTEIKAGTYDVKYEVNNSEATVMFYVSGKAKAVVTVKGKVVETDKPSEVNSMAIGKDASGREAIKVLNFSKKTTTIAFE